mmetsp:Transcript_15727/g.35533  ORF Transcript_15727/g.35533 Transcript_15727/m.35533 type:complete len:240 (-) Transcript_15727:306-1025(-)
MVDGGLEGDSRRLEWVVVGHHHGQREHAALEGRACWALQQDAPELHVVGCGEDVHALARVQPDPRVSAGHLLELKQDALRGGAASRSHDVAHLGHVGDRRLGQRLVEDRGALHLPGLCERLLGDRAEVHGLAGLPRRSLAAAAPRLQRDDALCLQELEAFAEVVDLVALAAGGANDPAEVGVGAIPHDDRIHDGPNPIHGRQRLLRRDSCVVLAVGEHQHAEVRARVLLRRPLKHPGAL